MQTIARPVVQLADPATPRKRACSRSAWGVLVAGLLSACSGPEAGSDLADMGGPASQGPTNALVAARPYESRVPSSYDASKPTPLVLLLHGFGANGLTQDLYFGLGDVLAQTGFLYAIPDGTMNSAGKQFWNANELCCDFEKTGVDDVAYISAIIDDMKARYNVDLGQVYLVGHSNGGFMSHRFACDRADRVAAIISLAGGNWKDPARCQPSQPVAMLQVHGDQDDAVPYAGGSRGGLMLPSAEEITATWAQKNGCQALPSKQTGALDLEANIDGSETDVTRYTGCRSGGAAELWTIKGGGHTPSFFRTRWPALITQWFREHKKPAP